jgi:hypothetical protein
MPKTLIALFFLISLSGLALAESSNPPQQAPSIKTEQQANVLWKLNTTPVNKQTTPTKLE